MTASRPDRHGVRRTDTSTGTWQTQDPTSFAAGQANLQEYVGNDPTNLTGATCVIDPVTTGLGAAWLLSSAFALGADKLGTWWATDPKVNPPSDALTLDKDKQRKYLPGELKNGRDKEVSSILVQSSKDLINEMKKTKTRRFKWVVMLNGDIRIVRIPPGPDGEDDLTITHTIASRGASQVKAAGWGELVDDETVILDGISGHYNGTVKNRDKYGVPAFEKYFKVKTSGRLKAKTKKN